MLRRSLIDITGVANYAGFKKRVKAMLPDLNTLLNYKHQRVIQNYMRSYLVDEITATDLFTDMLRYLWLSQKHALEQKHHPQKNDLQFSFVMHEEMRNIDNMWHTFILYTEDYTNFCVQRFGEYLHHLPDMGERVNQTTDEFANELEKFLSYVYDHLGEPVVRRWFAPHVT